MNQFHFLIALLLSTVLMPNFSMACTGHIEKSEEMEISFLENEHPKSCCGENDNSNKSHKSCSGKCEHSCCPCAITSSSSVFNLISDSLFKSSILTYFIDKKAKFACVSGAISDGYLTIWLIPKIG